MIDENGNPAVVLQTKDFYYKLFAPDRALPG